MEINEKRFYHIFPFGKVPGGSEIILWGAGEVGREYVQQLERTVYCRIKYIVDTNWAKIVGNERVIFPPEKIKEEIAPTVVIANADVKIAMKISERVKSLCLRANVVYEDKMCDIPEINDGKNAFYQLMDSIQKQADSIQEQKVLFQLMQLIPTVSLLNREVISIESCLKYLNGKEGHKEKWEEYCHDVRELLHIYGADGYRLVRVGGKHDGGYIMLDNFDKNQLAYSFGISDDVTWDKDIADRDIDVFMYDHTIVDLPQQHERFHFFRKGIAEKDKPDEQVYSLKTLIRNNNHEKEKNLIMKMDIEGGEWDVFERIEDDILKMFDQIVLELHQMTNTDNSFKAMKVLGKLNMTHAVVHVHGNNYGAALSYRQGIMPESLEVTYVNRDAYNIKEIDAVELPIAIDERNYCDRDEFILGRWNEF